MQAIILAAGMGTRISDHFKLPKGFIPIDDKPLIVHSIEKLKRSGIKEIAIIAGHLSYHYEKLAAQDSAITVIYNNHFANYSSLYSLYCAKDWIREDFLLLESDIIFEERALPSMINHKNKNIILLSGETFSGDEVYVEVNANYLLNMSKDKYALNPKNIHGEFVGINKLSVVAFRNFISLLENNNHLLRTGYYEEDGLVALSKKQPIYCLKIPDLVWAEIDNIQQLKRAEALYKKIQKEPTNAIIYSYYT